MTIRSGNGKLGDGVRRRVDPPDIVGIVLGEPEVAVGAFRDLFGPAGGRGNREFHDGVGRRVDLADLAGIRLGEPEVAIGPGNDPLLLGAAVQRVLVDDHRQQPARLEALDLRLRDEPSEFPARCPATSSCNPASCPIRGK